MSSTSSKAMSAGTAAYAVFALVRPRHLGDAVTRNPLEQPRYDLLARTFGFRDLAVSAIALLSDDPRTVRAAMAARIAFDLTDSAMLTPRADSGVPRAKVLGATLTWAALNTAAVVADRRRA